MQFKFIKKYWIIILIILIVLATLLVNFNFICDFLNIELIATENIFSGLISGLLASFVLYMVSLLYEKRLYNKRESLTMKELYENMEYVKKLKENFDPYDIFASLDRLDYSNMISFEVWNIYKYQISEKNYKLYNDLKEINKNIFLSLENKQPRDLSEIYIEEALGKFKQYEK